MNKFKAVFVIAAFAVLSGCAGPHYGGATIVGPFCTYPNETFVKTDTGETGFHVQGEDWYALMDLAGFKDYGERYVAPSQFLFMENDGGIRVSAFAEKIPGVDNSHSCTEYFKKLRSFNSMNTGEKTGGKVSFHDEMKEVGGLRFMVRDMSFGETGIRHIFYTPCYRGYCFDFHFSMNLDDASMEKVLRILGTLRFMDGQVPGSSVRKLVYTYDHRFELIIPDTWACSFSSDRVKDVMIPAITLKPKGSDRMILLITPFLGNERRPLITREQAKSGLLKTIEELAPNAREKPVLKEEKSGRAYVLSFVVEDKTYRPGTPNDWPIMRQGLAFVDDAALSFSIFYEDKAKEDARKAFDVITSSRVLNLVEAAEKERKRSE